MNFDLTEEQKGIQKAADEFAKGEFDKEVILDLERNHQFPFAYPEKGLPAWIYRHPLPGGIWRTGIWNPRKCIDR